MKKCPRCKTVKEPQEFKARLDRSDGLDSYCLKCRKEYSLEYRARNLAKMTAQVRDLNIRRDHGISAEEYDKRLEDQGRKCAICGGASRRMHLDHCHKTGMLREFLCYGCNVGIGCLKDDPNMMLSAISYVARHAKRASGTAGGGSE